MENQVEHKDFDFNNKKIEKILEQKPKMSEPNKKRARLAAFILMGALGIGMGFGALTNFGKAYLIAKEKDAKIAEITAQNEQIRKNQFNEISAKKQALQDEVDFKEQQKKKALDEKVALEHEKADYEILIKNKDSLIANYEAQLNIYDKAYQKNVQAVKDGLMSLDDLTEVRGYYQQYKDEIHGYIKFIRDVSLSFDTYTNQDNESKEQLSEEFKLYQSGGLHRNTDLENSMLNHVGDDSNDDEDDEELANLRKDTRNNIIDNIADIVKNDNVTTKTKKLKM